MTIGDKLKEHGISLPAGAVPAGAYIPTTQAGELVFVSGQLPFENGKLLACGKVGREIDLERARHCARAAAINALAALNDRFGSLEGIRRILRVEVFVNSAVGFTEQAQVANGASQLLHELFGEIGQHTRLAVGVAELPLNAPVELALIVQVR